MTLALLDPLQEVEISAPSQDKGAWQCECEPLDKPVIGGLGGKGQESLIQDHRMQHSHFGDKKEALLQI